MKIDFDIADMIENPFIESEKLEITVKNEFDNLINSFASGLLMSIESSESPIERLLGLHLKTRELTYESLADNGNYVVYPQYTVQVGTETYRIDFFIGAIYQGIDYRIAIECDGHEFHERTKEQVERDNKRARKLQQSGFIVIRFSGSEILKDPYGCAREANDIIFNQLDHTFIEKS